METWVPAKANADKPWGGERVGNLAYTGAGVIGITGVALLLIILGLILRRRNGEEE